MPISLNHIYKIHIFFHSFVVVFVSRLGIVWVILASSCIPSLPSSLPPTFLPCIILSFYATLAFTFCVGRHPSYSKLVVSELSSLQGLNVMIEP